MKKSILFFFIGIGVGILIPLVIQEGYNVDWKNATPEDVYKTFGLVLGGHASYITFLLFSIIVAILLVIPQIGKHIEKESKGIRLIAGTSVGFGIVQLITITVVGLPKIS